MARIEDVGEAIDFTQWTDRQLEVGQRHASKSSHGPALLAEIERRKEARQEAAAERILSRIDGRRKGQAASQPARPARDLDWSDVERDAARFADED